MTAANPDIPTDPRLSVPGREDRTTLVSAPPASAGLPTTTAPLSPPTTLAEPPGRVYSAGPGRYEPDDLVGGDRGTTTISEDVVERVIDKIVALTVAEVAGVRGLHAIEGQPVTVRLDGEQAEISLSIQVVFGHAVHQLVEQVRAGVIGQAERLLGLTVTEVNVLVSDVTFDAEGAAESD